VFGDLMRPEGEAALNSWAQAGGSNKPFVLSATEDLGQKLLDALNEIRGAALACQFLVPANMPRIDFGKVNLRVQSGGGTRTSPMSAARPAAIPPREVGTTTSTPPPAPPRPG
jgi:hypothetical protein